MKYQKVMLSVGVDAFALAVVALAVGSSGPFGGGVLGDGGVIGVVDALTAGASAMGGGSPVGAGVLGDGEIDHENDKQYITVRVAPWLWLPFFVVEWKEFWMMLAAIVKDQCTFITSK